VLLEEIGSAAFDSPFFANLIATLAMLVGGSAGQKEQFLPAVVDGTMIVSPAVEEPGVSYELRFVSTRATRSGGGYRLSGRKMFVPYATAASHLLVFARTGGAAGDKDGCTLLLVERNSPGIALAPLATIAPDRQFQVDFDDVVVPAEAVVGQAGAALPMLEDAYGKGTALICAEMVGGAAHQLAVTAEYMKQRVQFRPCSIIWPTCSRWCRDRAGPATRPWTGWTGTCRPRGRSPSRRPSRAMPASAWRRWRISCTAAWASTWRTTCSSTFGAPRPWN
jgi:alkylation response protein AidB-like acyl-CoA dehydrogenase